MTGYEIIKTDSPIIATALHDGHDIPGGFEPLMNLTDFERMREEDPYTAQFIEKLSTNKLIVHTSRFFVDLNREWHKAVYLKEEDAWGLKVWKEELSTDHIDQIKRYYDDFYQQLGILIADCVRQFGYFVILDIHSYNHRRQSPHREEPLEENPEINIGTRYNATKWDMATENFMAFLRAQQIDGKQPDVRENVKFKGGGMAQWINRHYGNDGFTLSIEFKKTFMDEWTGRAHIAHIQDIGHVLANASLFLLGMTASLNDKR